MATRLAGVSLGDLNNLNAFHPRFILQLGGELIKGPRMGLLVGFRPKIHFFADMPEIPHHNGCNVPLQTIFDDSFRDSMEILGDLRRTLPIERLEPLGGLITPRIELMLDLGDLLIEVVLNCQ